VADPVVPPKQATFVRDEVFTVIVGQAPHDGTVEGLITTEFPALSKTWICVAPPGGVTVVPVPKVTYPVVVILQGRVAPTQPTKGTTVPPQVTQSFEVVVVVCQFCHVYGPVPPETVKLPFVSIQTESVAQAVTVIVIDSDPHGRVYVIVCVPTPAVAGLKTPEAFTPGPDHVPPAVSGVRVTGASVTQIVVGPHTVALQQVAANGAQADAAND
jgi:hypothetical protein